MTDKSVNLDEANRLVAKLEADLAGLESGSTDVATLRTELANLRANLQTNEKLDDVLQQTLGDKEKLARLKEELGLES